jgi:hypothetical protein
MSAFSYTNGGWRNLAFAKVYKDEAWKEIKFTDKIRKNLKWHTILDDTYTFLFKRHSVNDIVDVSFTGVPVNSYYITDVNGKLLRTEAVTSSYTSRIRLDNTSQSLSVYLSDVGGIASELSAYGAIESIDLSSFKILKNLDINVTDTETLFELDISSNTNLQRLSLFTSGSTKTVDLSNNTKLNYISSDHFPFGTDSFKNNTLLDDVIVKHAGLVTVDLSNNKNLSSLNLTDNSIESITLPSAPTSRLTINLSNNKLSSSEVNKVLAWLVETCETVEEETARTANLQQSVAAPPTGQGLIDQRRLIVEFNYTVYTDGVLSNSITISPPENWNNPITMNAVLVYNGVAYKETLTRTEGEQSEHATQVYTGNRIMINGTGILYNWNLYLDNTLIATAHSNAKYPNTIDNWIFK